MKTRYLMLAILLATCGADDNEPEPCWEPFGPSYCIAPPDCRVPRRFEE